jgi:hypothetical protein
VSNEHGLCEAARSTAERGVSRVESGSRLARATADVRAHRGGSQHQSAVHGTSSRFAPNLAHNSDGKLVAFDTLGDETVPNRVFAK